MSRNLNVYVIRAAWLKDRERIVNDLQKNLTKHYFKDVKKTNIVLVTEHDPNDINGEIIQKTVNYAPIKEPEGITEEEKPKSVFFYNQFIKNMHLFQLSCVLKHHKALQEIATNSSENDINLILEDDVVYEEKMCDALEKVYKNAPADYDIVFMGLPTNREIKDKSVVEFQNTGEVFRAIPFADSYIVSKNAAQKICNAFLPIRFVMNIQLSYLIEHLGLKTMICLPNIFMNSSAFGMFLSTQNTNNILIYNNDYMSARNIVTREAPMTAEEVQKLEHLFKTSPIQQHPDFMYVNAQFLTKQKKYKEAQEVYENALKVYQANSCVVNHESMFLKDYIRLHKHLQA